MLLLILRRLAQAVPVLFLVSVGVFCLLHLLPGDPVRALVPVGDTTVDQATMEANIARARARYGLNDPLPVQYLKWLLRASEGDLGTSIATRQDVSGMITHRLPVTTTIGVMSAIIALAIAVPTGIISAVKRNSPLDFAGTIVSMSFVAIPGFWLGMLLILLFVVWLSWLPGPGPYVRMWDDPIGSFKLSILPAIALSSGATAAIMRLTRSAMLEVLEQDYIRTAKAKGLATRIVLIRHALRNAALPVVTILGFQVIAVFSGSVVIERVFAIPGVGSMAVDAIFSRDFPVVQGFVLVTATTVVLASVVVDVLYGVIDPRIRLGAT